jgi:hypothetical protein
MNTPSSSSTVIYRRTTDPANEHPGQRMRQRAGRASRRIFDQKALNRTARRPTPITGCASQDMFHTFERSTGIGFVEIGVYQKMTRAEVSKSATPFHWLLVTTCTRRPAE